MPDSKCSENVEGCLTAEDCDTGLKNLKFKIQNFIYKNCPNRKKWETLSGLECNRLAARPHCVDIDECTGHFCCPNIY